MADNLDLPGFHRLLADGRSQRVFVSPGPSGDRVLVLDLSGAPVRAIEGLPGACGLAVSRDGGTLYVALRHAGAIAEVDISGLGVIRWHHLPGQAQPESLARAGDTLWFGYHGPTTWNGRIGGLDPLTGRLWTEAHPTRYWRAPELAADDGVLLAVQGGLTPSAVHVYEVTGDVLRLSRATDEVSPNLIDAVLVPGGGALLAVGAAHDRVAAFTLPGLARNGGYAAGPYPNAVAIRPDGRYVAVGRRSLGGADVRVYRRDLAEPVAVLEVGGQTTLADRGLAWAPDGSALYAVTTPLDGPEPSLSVLCSSIT
ncbi:hypothetical protein [Nonomuraea sp. NPDC049158]|uniref:hypothetical protein n=1 Tax=Nonomuraea sp. NPDC049158 TaxID=3155649 RepID=UPI0033F1FEFA